MSHNFGFMGMINRVAGFIGPLIFSTLSLMVDERAGFIGLIIMASLGMVRPSPVLTGHAASLPRTDRTRRVSPSY